MKDKHAPPVELVNVLYVPRLTTNPVSANAMVSKGATVISNVEHAQSSTTT